MQAVKRLLWWILAGSVGGFNRGRILEVLLIQPRNAHELSQMLELDYKTIRHHLSILEKNKLVTTSGSDYGKMYFPSNMLEENVEYFNEIWGKIGKNKINKE